MPPSKKGAIAQMARATGLSQGRRFESCLHSQSKRKYMKRGNYKPRKNCLKAIFREIKTGDIRTIPISDVNVSSLRTKAGELNRDAGYSKYRVSVDSLLGVVRIAAS